jgi:hypothetical protein
MRSLFVAADLESRANPRNVIAVLAGSPNLAKTAAPESVFKMLRELLGESLLFRGGYATRPQKKDKNFLI